VGERQGPAIAFAGSVVALTSAASQVVPPPRRPQPPSGPPPPQAFREQEACVCACACACAIAHKYIVNVFNMPECNKCAHAMLRLNYCAIHELLQQLTSF
jgi:hypothetical protein